MTDAATTSHTILALSDKPNPAAPPSNGGGGLAEPDAEVTCGRDQAGHSSASALTLPHKHLSGGQGHFSTGESTHFHLQGGGGVRNTEPPESSTCSAPASARLPVVGEMHKMPLHSIRITGTNPCTARLFFFFLVKCKTETWKSASFFIRKKNMQI